jgi:hypothetical protein
MTSKCFNCGADAKWLTPLGYKICTGCKPHVVQGRKSSRLPAETIYVVTTDCDEETLVSIPDDVDEFEFAERYIRNDWGNGRTVEEVYPASDEDIKRFKNHPLYVFKF